MIKVVFLEWWRDDLIGMKRGWEVNHKKIWKVWESITEIRIMIQAAWPQCYNYCTHNQLEYVDYNAKPIASLYDDRQTFEKKGPSFYVRHGKLFEEVSVL